MTDKELRRCAASFRRGILGKRPSIMMCFAVCAPLQGYLSFLGVETELEEICVGDGNHFWLRLNDGRVLDPTADQFADYGGFKGAVYIGPERKPSYDRVVMRES